MVKWFFQPCVAAGLQAQGDGGLDFTGIGSCQAHVRKKESVSGIAIDVRDFVYKREAECCGTTFSFFPGGWCHGKVDARVPPKLLPKMYSVLCNKYTKCSRLTCEIRSIAFVYFGSPLYQLCSLGSHQSSVLEMTNYDSLLQLDRIPLSMWP